MSRMTGAAICGMYPQVHGPSVRPRIAVPVNPGKNERSRSRSTADTRTQLRVSILSVALFLNPDWRGFQ